MIPQPREYVVHLEHVSLGTLRRAVLEQDRVVKPQAIVRDDELRIVKRLEQLEEGAHRLFVLVAPERDHGRLLHGAQRLLGPGEDGRARDFYKGETAHLQVAHLFVAIVAGHVGDLVLGLNVPDHNKGVYSIVVGAHGVARGVWARASHVPREHGG